MLKLTELGCKRRTKVWSACLIWSTCRRTLVQVSQYKQQTNVRTKSKNSDVTYTPWILCMGAKLISWIQRGVNHDKWENALWANMELWESTASLPCRVRRLNARFTDWFSSRLYWEIPFPNEKQLWFHNILQQIVYSENCHVKANKTKWRCEIVWPSPLSWIKSISIPNVSDNFYLVSYR